MQTEPVYLYAPSTADGLITGRDTVGIIARLQGDMKIDLGTIYTLSPVEIPESSLASEEAWGLLDARLGAASNRTLQICAALEREDVLRLVKNAQALRAALYREEDLDRWPSGIMRGFGLHALRALRGGQPGLLKGQEALEICILPEPGLVRVAYRSEPIQIAAILSELADLLSVQERAD